MDELLKMTYQDKITILVALTSQKEEYMKNLKDCVRLMKKHPSDRISYLDNCMYWHKSINEVTSAQQVVRNIFPV